MSRARKGNTGLDRVKVAAHDKHAHRARLQARRTDNAVHYELSPSEQTPRDRVRLILEDGLVELETLRKRYGPHADFELVETHQRALLAELV